MSNITKTGIFNGTVFIDTYEISTDHFSYKPSAKSNSSINVCRAKFHEFYGKTKEVPFHFEADVTWTDFTGIDTSTFGMRFQGASFPIGGTTGTWTTNDIANAINNSASLTTLITNSLTGGSYHYSVDGTIKPARLASYGECNIGVRTDYSNGTGTISVSNIKLTMPKNKASISSDYINAENFYEY